jgi:hypothetical protein
MTDPLEIHGDPLEGLRAESFKHATYTGMDALVAIVPKDRETPTKVKQTVDDAGEGRWFPFEGGWKVMCPYTDQSFDPDVFVVEKGGWTHEHCDGCQGTIGVGDSCWVAEAEEGCSVICDTCYNRLKDEERAC